MSTIVQIGRRGRALVVLLAVLGASAAAWAYWSESSSGSASGHVATLGVPTIASTTPGGGTVALTWTPVTAPSDGAVSYYVSRDGGAAGATCPSATSPGVQTNCIDTGVPIGSHSYTVTAVWRSWTARSEGALARVMSGAATHLVLTPATSTPTAGAGDSLTITAKDASNNTVTSYSGSRSLTFSGAGAGGSHHPTVSSSAGTAVEFGAAEPIDFSSGVATVSGSSNGVMTLYKAETASIEVSDGTIDNGSGTSVTVAPGATASFALATPATQTAGVAFNETIIARDAYGNTASSYTGKQAIAFSGPSSSPGGSAPSYPSSVTFNAGSATAAITLFDADEGAMLTATQGAVSGTSASFTVNAAGASSFTLSAPGPQTAGAAFGETLTAKDPYGNVATTYAGSKSISFSGPASSPGGKSPSYPATVSFSVGAGTAQLTLYDAQATTLTATQSTITGTSTSFTVAAASASSFTMPTPGTQTAGTAFSETLTAKDAYGNTASGYEGAKTLTFGGPGESPGGNAPKYPASVSFAAGVGTATVTIYDAGATTLTAKDGSIAGATASFTVGAASAAALELAAASLTPLAGQSDNLTITAIDPFGNTATSYTGSKSLTFGGATTIGANHPTVSNASGAAVNFGSATTISFSGGVAKVSGSSNGVMKLYAAETAKVTVSDGTIGNNTGLSLTVAASSISTITVANPGTQTAGTPFSLTITAKDAFGNGASGAQSLSFSGPSSSPDGTVPTYPASVTFASGEGKAAVTLSDAQTTTITVAQGTVKGTSTSFTVKAAAMEALSLTAATTTPAPGAGDNLTITAIDPFGNTATSYTGSKSLTFGGATTIGANHPTVSNSSGAAVNFGSATTISFSGGVAKVSGSSNGVMKLYAAETAKVTVSDGTFNNGSGLPVTVEAPAISALILNNHVGGTKGRIEKDDTLTLSFTAQIAVNSFCSSWSGNGSNHELSGNGEITVTLNDGAGAGDDSLAVSSSKCTIHLGPIDLGSSGYVSGGNATYSGAGANASVIKYTAGTETLTIELGSQGGSGTTKPVGSSAATLTPDANLTDEFGNGLPAFTTSTLQQF